MRKSDKITAVVLDARRKLNEYGPDRIIATVRLDSDDLVLEAGNKLVIERVKKDK